MTGACSFELDPGSRWVDPEPPETCGEPCKGEYCDDHEGVA